MVAAVQGLTPAPASAYLCFSQTTGPPPPDPPLHNYRTRRPEQSRHIHLLSLCTGTIITTGDSNSIKHGSVVQLQITLAKHNSKLWIFIWNNSGNRIEEIISSSLCTGWWDVGWLQF